MYRDVSECIRMYRNVSGIGFLAKNQARYVPIHPDTFRFELKRWFSVAGLVDTCS